jgi:hypothetical protein
MPSFSEFFQQLTKDGHSFWLGVGLVLIALYGISDELDGLSYAPKENFRPIKKRPKKKAHKIWFQRSPVPEDYEEEEDVLVEGYATNFQSRRDYSPEYRMIYHNPPPAIHVSYSSPPPIFPIREELKHLSGSDATPIFGIGGALSSHTSPVVPNHYRASRNYLCGGGL